ncbi:hypothetical protein JXL19_12835 [bacterium]|nr:hypothetical protein [bacterium]
MSKKDFELATIGQTKKLHGNPYGKNERSYAIKLAPFGRTLLNLPENPHRKNENSYAIKLDELTAKLQEESLFKKMSEDIKNGNVFMAIRKNCIDFYHKGSKLFGYDKNGFKTNIKFASVYKHENTYIYESEISDCQRITSFAEAYERIKENCSLYAGIEANGVSKIYNKYSYSSSKENIVILDIEVSLKCLKNEKKQDRIDILFFNKNKQRLMFCEVKHFSNKEIWADKGPPKVVEQIERYEEQVNNETIRLSLLEKYHVCIDILNKMFPMRLPYPKEIDRKVILIVFGFDNDQKYGKLKAQFKENLPNSIEFYQIGHLSNLKIGNMFKK